jgi:HPt (histidine-containing phosphotransfer) domain-containing protein
MEVRNHGVTLPGVRDPYNVLRLGENRRPVTPDLARAMVSDLKAKHERASQALKSAVARNDGKVDLNELAKEAHKVAGELATAEEQLETAEAVEAAGKREKQRQRFSAVAKELQDARKAVVEHYRAAALALGRFYILGSEARELAGALADRPGNGIVYHPPALKEVLTVADENPNPLPALHEVGLREIQCAASWRRHIPLVPMKEVTR